MAEAPIRITDLRLHPDDALLASFADLYAGAFPMDREREDPAIWRDLLWNESPDPVSPVFHLFVAVSQSAETHGREVCGGLTAEFYRRSGCGLLAYLATAPAWRRRGVARRLMAHAMDALHRDAAGVGTYLRAVFGEVQDPRVVSKQAEAMCPTDRIRVLHRLGARWIDMPYIEPEVNPGHGKSSHLALIVFPPDGDAGGPIPRETIIAFVHDFYRAQGVGQPEDDPDVQRMTEHLSSAKVIPRSLLGLLGSNA
ncbi:MAG: GNAT family N-acetyltransferase [bacterium]|nr:GNAT family N-acetyltransferase [bacterium]